MTKDDTFMRIVYEHSGEEKQVPLSSLVAALVDFLDHFGVKSLVGHSFYGIVQSGDGATKLSRLLDACGHSKRSRGILFRTARAVGNGGRHRRKIASTASICPT